jgi:hypothetical protein
LVSSNFWSLCCLSLFDLCLLFSLSMAKNVKIPKG